MTQGLVAPDYTIVSDGSSAAASDRGGAACIVTSVKSSVSVKLAMFLGVADSTDAELAAGLIGLAFLHPLLADSSSSITWVSDSKPLIEAVESRIEQWRTADWCNSRGEKLRKRELWEALIYLKDSSVLSSCYCQMNSSAKSRHRACDKASRWVVRKGEKLLAQNGEGHIGRLGVIDPRRAWFLLDGREFIRGIKNGGQIEVLARQLVEHIQGHISVRQVFSD